MYNIANLSTLPMPLRVSLHLQKVTMHHQSVECQLSGKPDAYIWQLLIALSSITQFDFH